MVGDICFVCLFCVGDFVDVVFGGYDCYFCCCFVFVWFFGFCCGWMVDFDFKGDCFMSVFVVCVFVYDISSGIVDFIVF